MTRRERLEAVFAGERPDRTPILGGWIAAPAHIAALAELTLDQYWEEPIDASIKAYQALGSDGLIDIFVPRHRNDFRCVDADSYQKADLNIPLSECLTMIDEMPSPEAVEQAFAFESEYEVFRESLITMQKRCGDMVWMPARWGAGAKITWYSQFGYENFFLVMGLYPARAQKLMEVGGAQGRCQSRLVARAVEEGVYPHAVLLGEDICSQQGPMVSPKFMEKHYASNLAYALQPLLDVGCKPVWHCDGDVRPILDLLLASGVEGLQGFQPECGMTLDYVVTKRTRDGRPLLIFGPLAVTTELPVLSADEVFELTRQAIETATGKADLVLFTANTINPDIPLENIRAMHAAAGI